MFNKSEKNDIIFLKYKYIIIKEGNLMKYETKPQLQIFIENIHNDRVKKQIIEIAQRTNMSFSFSPDVKKNISAACLLEEQIDKHNNTINELNDFCKRQRLKIEFWTNYLCTVTFEKDESPDLKFISFNDKNIERMFDCCFSYCFDDDYYIVSVKKKYQNSLYFRIVNKLRDYNFDEIKKYYKNSLSIVDSLVMKI